MSLTEREVKRASAILAATALACIMPTAPTPGTNYGLVTGRAPLPTWNSPPPSSSDTVYPVTFVEQFDVTSSGRMLYSAVVGYAHLHPDSTRTYARSGCWKGYELSYERRADTLFLTLATPEFDPTAPIIPPFLLVHGAELIQPASTGDWHYAPAPVASTC